MMLALRLDGVERSSLCQVASADLGAGEARVKISHVGLCGSDLNSFRGLNPLVAYPRIPGHEAAGVIVELGSNASPDLSVGQTVIIWPYSACGKCTACLNGRKNACQHNQTLGVQRDGVLREEVVLPCSALVPNSTLPPHHMALVEPLSVGFHAARRGAVSRNDTVVVIGCGVIGLGAIMSAAQTGARVIAVDLMANKEAAARQMGAEVFLTSQDEALAGDIARLTDGRNADVVIEAVGTPQTFVSAVDLAAYCGRVVYVGYSKAPVTYETKLFNLKELDILGSRNAQPQDFEDVIAALLVVGSAADTLITQQFAMSEADKALPFWTANAQDCIKLMVTLLASFKPFTG